MDEDRFPGPEISVDEIMRRWPATIGVMLRHHFLCVGCPFGPFHTASDACAAHGMDEAIFSDELAAVIKGSE